jgi:5-methylcytosine-specific restriction endonuclease McrA
MRAPDDPYPDVLAEVIHARLRSDHPAALTAITTIGFTLPARRADKEPSKTIIARIFARDRYQCLYCGERVILTAVMRLIARLYPDQFPYHPGWKTDATHPAFTTRSATLDHLQPIAGGGDPLAEANLVTACWTCNRRKGDLTLDELAGGTLLQPRDTDWQGLSELYRPLWEASGRPELGEEERGWMRAVDRGRPNSRASLTGHEPPPEQDSRYRASHGVRRNAGPEI